MRDDIQALYDANSLALGAAAALGRLNRRAAGLSGPTLAGHGLTPAQFGVLEALYRRGTMRICELITTVMMTSGNITVVLKNMRCAGLIVKTQCPHDRRAYFIALSDSGRALIERALPDHIRDVVALFGQLSPTDLADLKRLLDQLADNPAATSLVESTCCAADLESDDRLAAPGLDCACAGGCTCG